MEEKSISEEKIILTEENLGFYLYLGMGICNNRKVVISVGYTAEYANKKALQFVEASNNEIIYEDISVIKIGDKEKIATINRSEFE